MVDTHVTLSGWTLALMSVPPLRLQLRLGSLHALLQVLDGDVLHGNAGAIPVPLGLGDPVFRLSTGILRVVGPNALKFEKCLKAPVKCRVQNSSSVAPGSGSDTAPGSSCT